MNRTPIEWTTFSANPLKYRDAAGRVVWGCVHKSEGCRNCYSEALAKRYGRGGPFAANVMAGLTPFMDAAELHHMRHARRIGGAAVSGSRCFVGDMTDVFGEWVPEALLIDLFVTFAARPDVTWQVLTKRPDRMRALIASWSPETLYAAWHGVTDLPAEVQAWPLPNVWLGTSVEDQRTADERIPELLQTPAAVHFISQEPQLAVVYHRVEWLRGQCQRCGAVAATNYRGSCDCGGEVAGLDWVIVGGESGPGARPFNAAWARSTVKQCRAAGVAVFVKQMGAYVVDRNDAGFEAENETWAEGPDAGQPTDPGAWPTPRDVEENISGYRDDYQGAPVRVHLHDRKGGDPDQWPLDLRVREFPA